MTLFWTMLLSGCRPEVEVRALEPSVAVAPEVVAFGEQAVPLATTTELFITNAGQATLTVDLSLEEADTSAFAIGDTRVELAPDGTHALSVDFHPQTYQVYEATLVISSNDPDNPEVRVPVSGEGVAAPMPSMVVSPTTIDFGDVDQGGTSFGFFSIRNVGGAPLLLGDVAQTGSGAFRVQTSPSDAEIAPDGELPVIIEYQPSTLAGDSGFLVIPSNDPLNESQQVVLLGNGGGDYDYPVAVIDCPGLSDPPAWVDLSGKQSSDPEGHEPLEYSWTLTQRPFGSQANLTNTITDETELFTDLAGDYEVQLVVTNTLGTTSSPAVCEIAAIPDDELHVELTWDTSGADLDLHLLDGTGGFFEKPGDCNFCNPNPMWGQTGNDDDPRLDIDDRGGFGPENINLKTPNDGVYDVKVHYFEEHGDDAVTATVTIFTYGVEAWQGAKVLKRNEVWDVARVNWPDGTVAIQTTDLYDAVERSCWD